MGLSYFRARDVQSKSMRENRRDALTVPSQASRVRAVTPLLFAIAVGLVAGAAEIAVQALFKFGLGRMVWTGWHALWTTPMSYALLLMPLGAALSIVHARWPRVAGLRIVLFLPVAAASFSVLWLFYPALHRLAVLMLAVGLATAATRWLADRPAFVERAGQRLVVGGALVVFALAVAIHGGRALAEQRGIAALPPAAAGAPNVLVIVLDAVRAQNLSLYGYTRPTTPALDAFAKRGVTFNNAWSTSPWTLPSHASMFTGRYAREFRADATHRLEDGFPTLSEVLAGRGYRTAGFVANVSYAGREAGLARGFAHFEDYVITPAEFVMSSAMGRFVVLNPGLRRVLRYYDVPGRRTAADITGSFLRWADEVGDRPFFAFLNLYDAHEPYLPPDSVAARFPGPVPRQLDQTRYMNVRMAERTRKTLMPPLEQRAEEAAYDAAIATIDAELGRLFQELERRQVLDRTITVVVADHGEMFGEHGLFSHGHSLYRPLLHVPLAIVYPQGMAAGNHVDHHVSLRDLPATILVLAGVAGGVLPGVPLLPADSSMALSPIIAEVRPSPGLETHYPASRGVMHSIVGEGYQYIRDGQGKEELFALSDTAQSSNLAAMPEHQQLVTRLRAALDPARIPD